MMFSKKNSTYFREVKNQIDLMKSFFNDLDLKDNLSYKEIKGTVLLIKKVLKKMEIRIIDIMKVREILK